jgi:hypothetical protein
MVDAVSSSPTYLENNRTLSPDDDNGNRDQELAMGAVVFRDLQREGLIDKDAKLADRPPASGKPAGLRGTSYEARLTELVTDQDKNGKLDIDLDRLSKSGMLTKPTTPAELERVLSGPQDQLSDKFIGGQDPSRSKLSAFGIKNQRGQDVQDASKGMVLSGAQERQTQAFIDDAKTRMKSGPEEAKRVADEAIMGAQVLTQRGDQRNAQALLSGTGDALQAGERLDQSARVWRELRKPPYKDTPVNVVQDKIDEVKVADPNYKDGQVIQFSSGVNTDRLAPDGFKSTYGATADRRLAQIDQNQRMNKTLGRPASPQSVDDARDYFNAYAKGKTTDQVRTEYQSYLKNFYVHTGDGVDWDPKIDPKDRPAQLQSMLNQQDQTKDGRTLVDCEGFSYLTDHILGGVSNPDGSKRFDVTYARNSEHVITGVFDRGGGLGFTVNNSNTTLLAVRPNDPAAENNAIASQLAGSAYEVLGFGANQDDAAVWSGGHLKPGAMVYDGATHQLVGSVTSQFADAFDRARAERGGYLSASQFVGLIDQGKIRP